MWQYPGVWVILAQPLTGGTFLMTAIPQPSRHSSLETLWCNKHSLSSSMSLAPSYLSSCFKNRLFLELILCSCVDVKTRFDTGEPQLSRNSALISISFLSYTRVISVEKLMISHKSCMVFRSEILITASCPVYSFLMLHDCQWGVVMTCQTATCVSCSMTCYTSSLC